MPKAINQGECQEWDADGEYGVRTRSRPKEGREEGVACLCLRCALRGHCAPYGQDGAPAPTSTLPLVTR